MLKNTHNTQKTYFLGNFMLRIKTHKKINFEFTKLLAVDKNRS